MTVPIQQVIKPEALYLSSIRRAKKLLDDTITIENKTTRIYLLKLAIEAIHTSLGVIKHD